MEGEREKLLKLDEILHERVVGQDEAVEAVSYAVIRARSGLKDPRRPIGSFIFLGPTGVGKTELARTLAAALFDSEDNMVRIDMSEYMEKHAVSRLIGAPPGYVGYEEGGQLTEAVRRRPYSVILFDEIEKAHPDVFNILLQVLEEGQLQDSLGHTVSFRNTVLIMTSNAGAREITRESSVGFKTLDGLMDYRDIKSSAMNELKRLFRPEFINRVDEIVVFHSLDREQVRSILEIELAEVQTRLAEKEITLEVTKKAKEHLIDVGYDVKFGARPLRRSIQREIEDPLAMEILRNRFGEGSHVVVTVRNEKISFREKKAKKKTEEQEAVASTT
jgi:ATP-dependent Clp protease ATP-binding subunit ClpC